VRVLPFAVLALVFCLAVACSSSSNDETASLIHRLLQAATSGQSSQLESFPGKLPDGVPVKPPQYPGAKLIVSSRQPASTGDAAPTPDASGDIAQPMLYLIVLDTADSREKVFSFYEDALEEPPWQIASTFSTADLDTLQFADVNDADISGVVTIARGGKDNRTSILISLQDAGAFRKQLPPFKLQESLPVPRAFPTDVPRYKGGTVTSTAFVRTADTESFLLVFLTKDSKDAVVSFYRSAFQGLGWSVQSGAPLGVEQRFNFQDAAGDVQGDVIADAFAQDATYTEVRIQFRQKPGRAPGGATTPVPTSASTPAPTLPSSPQPTPS
jgi:hypothetical protein